MLNVQPCIELLLVLLISKTFTYFFNYFTKYTSQRHFFSQLQICAIREIQIDRYVRLKSEFRAIEMVMVMVMVMGDTFLMHLDIQDVQQKTNSSIDYHY